MIRLGIFFIGVMSLIYGSIFFFSPYWFADLTEAKNINIAWLRNIGASIIGLLFFGCSYIFYKPRGTLALLKVITITSALQTFSLIFSRFYNEFSAEKLIVIDITIFLAIFVCIFFILIIKFKSRDFK